MFPQEERETLIISSVRAHLPSETYPGVYLTMQVTEEQLAALFLTCGQVIYINPSDG